MWAQRVEVELTGALAKVDSQSANWQQITCKATTCEVLAVFQAADADREQAVLAELNSYLGAAAAQLGMDVTMAAGGDVPAELALIAFIHKV